MIAQGSVKNVATLCKKISHGDARPARIPQGHTHAFQTLLGFWKASRPPTGQVSASLSMLTRWSTLWCTRCSLGLSVIVLHSSLLGKKKQEPKITWRVGRGF